MFWIKSSCRHAIVLSLLSCSILSCNMDSPVEISEQLHLALSLESALSRASVTGEAGYFRLPKSTQLDAIPQDPRNPITQEKVTLGRLLYHETGMGNNPVKQEGEYTYSCASCHHAAAGFQAGRQQGIGEGGTGFGVRGEARTINSLYQENEIDVQPIRSPSALNVAFQRVMLWNGQFGANGPNAGTNSRWIPNTPIAVNELGYDGVESQAIAGLTVHRMLVDRAWVLSMEYQSLFDAAFPTWEESRRYSNESAGLAIAAYERTLLAQQAPFQRFLAGDRSAMSESELEGAILFFGKANCVSCHTGPALNSERFYALGMNDLDGPGVYGEGMNDKTQLGRGGFTGLESDHYKFKVPQLYNLKDSPFLGHGGTFRSIREVVEYKNQAVSENPLVSAEALDTQFSPLHLSDQEVESITIFLRDGLYDPALLRYVPENVISGFCFPNADDRSREDLGCW